MVFEPATADGAPAGIGASGRWLSAEDLFAADAKDQAALSSLCSADWLPLIFPRDWPAVFTRETLKVMVNKTLRGVRCRAVVPPSAAEVAAAARLGLRPLHSFDNAEAVAATLGWPVVKGFLVLERVDAGADGASFVAIRHWWNVRESGTREGGGREGGVWLDLTPRPWGELSAVGDGGGGGHGDARVVLVESLRGEKLAAPLSAAGRDFATALAARLGANTAPLPLKGATAVAASATAPAATPAATPATSAAVPALAAPATTAAPPATAAAAPPAAAARASRKFDYSKWDQLVLSGDEEEQEVASGEEHATARAAAAEQQLAEAARREGRCVERRAVRAAVDAAAAAAAAGDAEALERLVEGARSAAPLDPATEAVLSRLPQAAQIAARAAAAIANAGASGGGGAGGTAGGGGGGGDGAAAREKRGEPSLRELLSAAQGAEAGAEAGAREGAEEEAADPELEDPDEFVDDLDVTARAEAERDAAAAARTVAGEVARARAAEAAASSDRLEWVGEWADYSMGYGNK